MQGYRTTRFVERVKQSYICNFLLKITGFATTNIYFHLSTAYGILRSKGVQIGKVDLFAGGL